jgi:glutamyl-tRNA reductase
VPSTPFGHPHETPAGSAPEEVGDPAAGPLVLSALELSLATASLDTLESVARTLGRVQVSERFDQRPETEEAALLSTCHRVELFLLTRDPEEVDQWREALPGAPGAWVRHDGDEAVRHLFRVAAGLESLAVGEAEVRQQVRRAATDSVSRHPRPVLRELFRAAARAAEEAAPEVPLERSIAAIASAHLLTLIDRPWPHVLVVGSGTVGRQVAEILAPSTRLTLIYHRNPPEAGFLRSVGGRARPMERLAEEFADADAIVTAAKFGSRGLRAVDLPRGRRLVLVDLGVPRNIDPDVRELPNVRLVDLEELHGLPSAGPRPATSPAQIEARAADCSDRLDRQLLEPWIGAFRRSVEALRRTELETARPFLGPLDPRQEAAIDRLTQRLVTRLLSGPTERLRSLPPGPEGDARRRWAAELLGAPPPGP